MAVTSQNAVRSVQGYTPGTFMAPLPDAPVQAGHLAMIAWLYAGVSFTTASGAAVAASDYIPMYRRRHR